jgi:outer membrane protein OmpA-like peptidoglycan-associated protein
MKNVTKLVGALFLGALFTTKTASAQMPGSLVPIVLLKHATGYWDNADDAAPEAEAVAIVDTDGDGVPDSKDKCPDVKGSVANNGCILSVKELAAIKDASSHIYFESGSAKIKEESFKDLDKLVKILKSHPEVKAKVEGHTDSSGDAAKNLQLSKDRAASVMKYLVEHGEKPDHVSSEGYGITKPIAPNDTKEGKAKNRRVEVLVSMFE